MAAFAARGEPLGGRLRLLENSLLLLTRALLEWLLLLECKSFPPFAQLAMLGRRQILFERRRPLVHLLRFPIRPEAHGLLVRGEHTLARRGTRRRALLLGEDLKGSACLGAAR